MATYNVRFCSFDDVMRIVEDNFFPSAKADVEATPAEEESAAAAKRA